MIHLLINMRSITMRLNVIKSKHSGITYPHKSLFKCLPTLAYYYSFLNTQAFTAMATYVICHMSCANREALDKLRICTV